MNTLTFIGKPHKLPLELFEPHLDVELNPGSHKLEKDISSQIEALGHPIIIAHYNIEVMESEA